MENYKTFRRILTFVLVLSMVFTLAACSTTEDKDINEQPDAETKYAHITDVSGTNHYLYRDSENPYPFEIVYMYKTNTPLPYKIKNGDVVVTYGYDDENYRISKDVNGALGTFEYEKSFYHDTYQLVREVRSGVEINYLYQTYGEIFDGVEMIASSEDAEANDIVYDRDHLYGFTYQGETYRYVRADDGYIVGIKNGDGEEIAKYEYEGRVITQVLGLNENGEWVDMGRDETFIGNVNKVRAWSEYYDDETGWYCNGGGYYDDPVLGTWVQPKEKQVIMIDEKLFD